jgi:serine/threonine protein kinase
MHQVSLAINYMHTKCIVHRDVKPLNMVFTGDEDDATVKLIDFDAAATCPDIDTGDPLRGVYGTPNYLAPEILIAYRDNAVSYDSKADIWSLGVSLFKTLCGQEAFNAPTFVRFAQQDSDASNDMDDDDEWMQEIKAGKYHFKNEGWADISELGVALVRDLLTVDPDKRPSAADVLSHKWFEGSKEKRLRGLLVGDELAASVLNAFVAFLEVSAELRYSLQRLCYSKVDFEMQRVLPLFHLFDRKSEGVIDLDDFTAALEEIGADISRKECEDLFDKLTACFEENKDKARPFGYYPPLSYSEFMAATLPIITQPAFLPQMTDGHGIGLSVLDIESDLRTAFNLHHSKL